MNKKISVLFAAIFLVSTTTLASSAYPLQEYELLVIESLPEAMNLNMTLSEIEKSKEDSRIGTLKRRLNASVFNRIAPLLASTNISEGFNLLQLPKLLPLREILDDLALTNVGGPNPLPVDFIVIITPRRPVDIDQTGNNRYAKLYPSSKGNLVSVVSNPVNPMVSYEYLLNLRMQEGADFLFERQYKSGAASQAFFAGAMIAIHAEGSSSTAKAKIALGLPTDLALPFEQANDQIKLTQLLLPRTPYNGYVTKMDNAIAMATFEHKASGENPAILKIAFGTLGPLEDSNVWNVGQAPSDSTVSRWFSWMNPYNVPHFRGEIRSLVQKEQLGFAGGITDWLNGFLGNNFDIQLNLHELTIDVLKVEITDVKMTVDLPWKGGSEVLPTFRNGEPETQFKNEGNKVLNEQKAKVQEVLDKGLTILADENVQLKLLETLESLLEKKGAQ